MHWDEPSVILMAIGLAITLILNFVRVINNRLTRMELNHKEHAEKDDKRFVELENKIDSKAVEMEKRLDISMLQKIRVATIPFEEQIKGLKELLQVEHTENRDDRKDDKKEIRDLIEGLGDRLDLLADRRNSVRAE